MKYETAFICLAVLIAVPIVQGLDVPRNPGESHEVDCQQLQENITVNIHCLDCTENNETCPECPPCDTSRCTILTHMYPGEIFEMKEGTCNVEAYCDYEETAKNVEKNYTFRMKLNKHEGDDIYLGIEVVDFLNTITDSETYDWSRDSIVSITEEFDFTCPTKVIFDSVNADTCACLLYTSPSPRDRS